MYVSWIFAFAFYTSLINAELNISLTSQCKTIPHDDIRIANGNCYTMHKSKKNWGQAEKACEDLGGKLAFIEEWSLLRSFFERSIVNDVIGFGEVLMGHELLMSSGQYWIGAKERRDGNFKWLDGRKVPNENWDMASSIASTMKNWIYKVNSCLTIQENGYEQESCSKNLAYICEHDFSAHDSGGNITNPNNTDGQEIVKPGDSGNPNKTTKDIAAKETSQPRTTLETQEVLGMHTQRPQNRDDENVHTVENKNIAANERSQPRTTLDTQEVLGIPTQRPQDRYDENGHTVENENIAADERSQPPTTLDTQEVIGIPTQRPQDRYDENGHTVENETPKREPQTATSILQVFKGVRSVCNQFNPRLKAKPDQIGKARGVVECLRVCYDRSDCNLVNFFPPDHCAMYSDPARVRELGVEYKRGWTVWKTENVREDLDDCESTRKNGI